MRARIDPMSNPMEAERWERVVTSGRGGRREYALSNVLQRVVVFVEQALAEGGLSAELEDEFRTWLHDARRAAEAEP